MNLLILSDLTPPVKIGKKLEDLFATFMLQMGSISKVTPDMC